jgi:hypothetical protein
MLLRVVAATLALAGSCNSQVDIEDAFQVDFSSNLNGGCAYVGQTNLNNLATDAQSLGLIGIQLANDYANNVGAARRLLDSFFQVPNPPMNQQQLQAIYSE